MQLVFAGASGRASVLLAILLAVLCAAPWLAGDYLLTVLITILYLAYVGQAWNVMMGFAGQLSLGHAIYVGLAARERDRGRVRRSDRVSRISVRGWRGVLRHSHHCLCRIRAHRL
jgi:hypothetical protein